MKKSPGRHRKILAVDDEPKNIKLIEAILIPEGYAVETATNGQEALDNFLNDMFIGEYTWEKDLKFWR